MTDMPDITLDDLRGLLAHISADDRDTWVQVAMGVKAEFGEGGFDEWDSWSQTGAGYKAAEALSVWKSCKGGKVGIGTVVHLAKQGGWKLRKQDLTAAERKQRKADQDARRKARQAEIEADEALSLAMQQKIQEATLRLLAEYTTARGKSEYLDRKGVAAFGVRFVSKPVVLSIDAKLMRCDLWADDDIRHFFSGLPNPRPDHHSFMFLKPGTFLIPLSDLSGAVWSFQSIAPNGKKLFPKFSRKQGCCYWVGKADPMPVIALAEGYATAASVYHATEWPTVMCVDVGNMVAVGRQLRQRYRDAVIMIAGDDDPTTKDNPGRTKAEALAAEIGAVAVFPKLPEQGSEAA
ncbi:putative DNA primase/helicase [Halopseudomonas litoralis]|uniref:Putative DNA primase/helicase n=1 Tax=Halopseudomonas litoralis TaxID=797277 RepID=A0A1H1NV90_9GAMM|nr:PriCT-2 domain-containing protein [Halopseudomonas litoralis]SDS02730.1 putative DNA primase/helicase [Halopseudomonas litoralis]